MCLFNLYEKVKRLQMNYEDAYLATFLEALVSKINSVSKVSIFDF